MLEPQPPRVGIVHDLLSKRLYKGEENENMDERDENMFDDDFDFFDNNDDRKMENERNIDLSFESLRSMVQASDKEILDALHEMDAIEINGEWRLLDTEYWIECVEDCLNTISSCNISYDAVDIDLIHQLYVCILVCCGEI